MIYIKEHYLTTDELKQNSKNLSCGDKVYLTGTIYTARDQAHKRICEILEKGSEMPFELDGSIIYYAGPTPAPENMPIGSCGPTTSSRMDKFSPTMLDNGLLGMIGKGDRAQNVYDSIIKNGGIYFSAIGGCGALIAKSVIKSEIIAFSELGCEAVRKMSVKDFPAIVAIDYMGNSIYR